MSERARRKRLVDLERVLQQFGEERFATLVRVALSGTTEDIDAFLVSDDLWGGSGSIADSAGTLATGRLNRREIEAALILLGEQQIADGIVNARTSMWVDAFTAWRPKGM